MKVAIATSLFASLPSALGLSRRLQDAAAVDAYDFLQDYEQVYLTCDPSMEVTDVDGNYDYGAVVYRLCPKETACVNGNEVCSAGYGDYVVGFQTFMENFMEQFQRAQNQNGENQNQNNDGNFNMKEFGQCGQMNVKVDQEEGAEAMAYYVGPLCSNGDIRFALFVSAEGAANPCVAENESLDVTFYELTGFDLPFSNSLLMDDDKCKAYYCYGYNDRGELEYNEYCTTLFDSSIAKCETKMETFSYLGKTETGCEQVTAMLPKGSNANKKGGAGWFVFALLVAAVAGFGIWYFLAQKKKSTVNQEGLMM